MGLRANRDTRLCLRIAAPLRQQLDAVAKLTGQTVSELARDILINTLAEVGLKDDEATRA